MAADMEDLLRADLGRALGHVGLEPLAGRHLFLTGCTGFVGAWLLRALSCLNGAGAQIRATVLTRDASGFSRRHPRLAASAWLHPVEGDVKTARLETGPVDFVIHGAAAVRPEALRDGYAVLSDLMVGTRHVLEHAAASGAGRILLLSSGAVYGPLPNGARAYAEHLPCTVSPADAYACGKVAMEALALAHARNGGPSTVIARMFAFIGPWLPEHLAVAQILRMAAEDGAIVLDGDGSPVRSFLYGADMAAWLLTLLAHGENGLICNVGSDEAHALIDLAHLTGTLTTPAKPVRAGTASPDPVRKHYVPDIGLARRRFGLAPWTPLSTALARHFAWQAASRAGSRTS